MFIQCTSKMFKNTENISKIIPQYFQAMTQLQEECMKICEKIDATAQNFKTFNDNINSFVELNENTIQS